MASSSEPRRSPPVHHPPPRFPTAATNRTTMPPSEDDPVQALAQTPLQRTRRWPACGCCCSRRRRCSRSAPTTTPRRRPRKSHHTALSTAAALSLSHGLYPLHRPDDDAIPSFLWLRLSPPQDLGDGDGAGSDRIALEVAEVTSQPMAELLEIGNQPNGFISVQKIQCGI